MYYLLKGGIVFFLIALWMYWRLIRGSYDILRYSNSEFAKYMAVSIIAGMMGIFLTGMLNANLVRFKLNIIYALFFAYVEFERENILKAKKSTLIDN